MPEKAKTANDVPADSLRPGDTVGPGGTKTATEPAGKTRRPFLNRRQKILAVIAVVLASVGVVLLLVGAPQTVSDAEHQQAMQKIQQLQINQKFDEAEQFSKDYLKHRLNSNQRYDVSIALAATYESMNNHQQARHWYMAAYDIDSNRSYRVALGVADTSLALGDKPKAIEYYRKVIELIKQDKYALANGVTPEFYELRIQKIEKGEDIGTNLSEPQPLPQPQAGAPTVKPEGILTR